jgi:hypothetical protein
LSLYGVQPAVTPVGDGESEGDAAGDGEGVALEDAVMGVDVEPAVGDGPQAEITASKEATPPTWNMTRLVRPVITEPLWDCAESDEYP